MLPLPSPSPRPDPSVPHAPIPRPGAATHPQANPILKILKSRKS